MTVFWPVHEHEFINYDDPDYVTRNQHVQQGFTAEGVRWAFTQLHGEMTYWHPITWLSHMLDCQLFGLNPGMHHLMNLFFHSANAVLLFVLLNALTGAFWRSFVVAAIFALHPIQVDTVAWIAERKNVLSTLFLLLTLLAYGRYARKPAAGWYVTTMIFYVFGLMTKPMLVVVPGILLLLDYWPLQRFRFCEGRNPVALRLIAQKPVKCLLLEKVPFVVLALMSAGITLRAHQALGMEHFSRGLPLSLRLENALVSYTRYIGKIIAPQKLAVFYPHPGRWSAFAVIGSATVLIAGSFAALRVWRRWPFVAFGWCWFLGTLLPVLGIIQAGLQGMADRFAYVPMIGLVVLIVWSLSEFLHRRATVVLASSAIAASVVATSVQVRYWTNSETLWRHALHVTKNNFIAHHNLGHVLIEKEEYPEALSHTQEALRLKPDLIESHYQLAVIYERQGRYDQAIAEYENTLRMKWDWAEAHRALLNACYEAGRTNSAIQHLQKLLRVAPKNAGGHLELGQALQSENRMAEAVEEYREVTRLAPAWAIPQNNLAWILATSADARVRNGAEAVALAHSACRLTEWNQPIMVGTLAAAYAENAEFEKACEAARRAADLADSLGQKDIAERNRTLLKLYEKKTPYQETAR